MTYSRKFSAKPFQAKAFISSIPSRAQVLFFIVRLIQSDLIKPRDLMRKYFNELHTNEIILLAHYIATINIENAFHDRVDAKNYQPFERICFTDTFQAYEQDDNAKGQTDFKDNEIYIFNLRGDIRAKERADSKRDGENVFNIMTGVAITILVKNHEHIGDAKIFYKDIGDYLKREQKFNEQNLYYDNGLNERHYKDWAAEHDNPRYILDLILSCITVSLKTLDIVENLPDVEFRA